MNTSHSLLRALSPIGLALALTLVALVTLGLAASPLSALVAPPTPAPPAPTEEDVIPGPFGQWGLVEDALRAVPRPRLGARALNPYVQPAAGEDSCQRWPYGSPDQNFGYLSDVQWTPASPGVPAQAWAVGFDLMTYRGLAMRWDGSAWQRTPLPAGAGLISKVSPLSVNDVWAAGESFIHWDGTAWSIAGSLESGEADTVLTLQMLSPTLGFAGTFAGYTYTWDGATWTRGEKISPFDVQALYMFDAQNGWAVGQQGVLLRCHNGEWSRVYSPVSHHLLGITFVSPDNGWIVGTRGTFLHWDGRAWTPVSVPEASATLAVAMRSATDGWAVGELGKVFRWDGHTWTRVEVADVANILLTSVAATSSANAFIVGSNGTVLRWDGRAWTPIILYTRAPVFLHDACMATATDGWAVGDNGYLLHWDGQDWQPQEPLEGNPSLYTVDMLAPTDIWMGGAGVIAHGDGVGEWVLDEVPAMIMSVYGVPPEGIFAAGYTVGPDAVGIIYTWTPEGWEPMEMPESASLVDIRMCSSNFGFAVGLNGAILRWSGFDGAWTPVESPTNEHLYSVEFVAIDDWWIVGAHGTILHGDGQTWTVVESPLPDHLLRTVRLSNTKFVTNNELWIGGEEGALLHWDWDTRTWQVVPSNTANMISGVGGVLNGEVWAVGEFGAIVRYGPTYTIGGRVTDALSGAGLPGLEVRVASAANADAGVRTGANGVYTFPLVLPSTYTVTVATAGYSYTPTQQVVTVPPDAAAVDFTARRANTWKCWPGDEAFACSPNLAAIQPAGGGKAWAVGESGAIFYWDGARRLRVASPTGETLNGLAVLSRTDAWAVGLKGTVLHWNGISWQQVDTGDTTDLGAVAALAPDDVWVAGQDGIIRHWNGSAWQTVPSGTDDTLLSLSMPSATDGWAVGGRADMQQGLLSSVILHWDGHAWSKVFSPAEKPLMSVSMVSPTLGWAAGLDGLLRWNGSYWAMDPDAESAVFSSVNMRSATEGWATGFQQGQPAVAHWDGQTWTVSQLGVENMATGIAYVDEREQLLVGLNGLTGRRQGDGDWMMRELNLGDSGMSVDALAPNDVWMTTMDGSVLRWDGTQWNMQAEKLTSSGNIIRTYAADDVWLGAYDGYVGHWDGTQWTNLGEQTDKIINHVMKVGPNDVWASGGRFIVQDDAFVPFPELMQWNGSAWTRPDLGDLKTMFSGMVNFGPNDIWVSGYGGVMLHYDGHTWSSDLIGGETDYILSLAGRAPNDIWGVGVGGAIVHYDGTAWQNVESPTELQLGELKLLPDGTGWAAGWDIARFDGQQWRLERSPTGKLMMSLALTSDHDGWAVGAEGVKLCLGPSYSARGAVTDQSGEPLVGVEIYSSQSEVVFTDVDGSFVFGDLAADSITITPTLKGWVFGPPSRTFTAPPAAEGLDFTAQRYYPVYLPLVCKQN